MAKFFPPKIDIFLVADALRQEPGGKITIMGAYSAGRLILPAATALPAHLPLAFYAVFHEGSGTFDAKVCISDPNGKPMAQDLIIGPIIKSTEQSMQVVVNFGLFALPMVGKYQMEFFLDDRRYTEYFSVSLAPDGGAKS